MCLAPTTTSCKVKGLKEVEVEEVLVDVVGTVIEMVDKKVEVVEGTNLDGVDVGVSVYSIVGGEETLTGSLSTHHLQGLG